MKEDNFLKTLKSHPLVKKIVSDEENERVALRKKTLAEISIIEDNFAAQLKTLDKEISQRGSAVAVSRARLALEQEEYFDSLSLRRKTIVEKETSLGRLRGILLKSYPEAIDEFIHEMINLHDATKNQVTFRVTRGEADVYTDGRSRNVNTNSPAIVTALEYILAAIREAENMKISDLDGADVQKRLDELRTNIPDVEQFVQIERLAADVTALGGSAHVGQKISWFKPPNG
jgi:hypothetical protein